MKHFFALDNKELFTWIGIMGGRSFTAVLTKGILRPFAVNSVKIVLSACHHTSRFRDA